MAGETRVPRKDSKFDQYIRNTTIVLENGTPIGSVRLGLSTAQANQWIAYRDEWIIVYPKYTDPAQRTKTIKNLKNQLKKNFILFVENPLKIIEASPNLTADDRGTFNLPERDRTKTARGAITTVPYGSLTGKNGGILQVRVRTATDATRASMHKLADVVEFRYIIINVPNGPEPPAPPQPGDLPSPEDMPLFHNSKAALWRMNLGTVAQGKRIVGFFRWVNQTNPDNNSGWSNLATTFIS